MNIMIPTDFSTPAKHAALFVLGHKEFSRAKIFLFHAGISSGAKVALNTFTSEIRESVNDNSFEFSEIIQEGSFNHGSINKLIAKHQIELVVLGTHGREGTIQSLLGSNTSHVISNIDCPVLAIPETFQIRPIKKIGYTSDLTMLVKEVGKIMPFARILKAAVDIVHIYPVFPQQIDPDQYDKSKALEHLNREYQYSKFKFHFIKTDKENYTLEGVQQYSAANKPDMLAIFTRERSLFDKLFDPSLTANLAVHTHIPLLSIPVIKE